MNLNLYYPSFFFTHTLVNGKGFFVYIKVTVKSIQRSRDNRKLVAIVGHKLFQVQ